MKRNICYKLAVIFFALVFIILFSVNRTNAIYRETKSATIDLNIVDGGILCKKATTIHSEACNQTNSNLGCRAAGYASGEIINYGSIINSDTLKAGDVFDCNVDGTGYNQRFYYLRTLDNKAVLIYYTNFEGQSGPGTTNNYTHDVAHDMLPTTTQWNNLPVTFEVQTGDYRPARFITYEDLETASGKTNLTAAGAFDNINFIFENTTYANTTGHSTVWLEDHGTTRYRYHKDDRKLVTADKDSSVNAVRPVIEVPLTMIDNTYVIRFDANGGTVTNEYMTVTKGSSLGTLPTPTKEASAFVGWYTDTSWNTQIDSSTIPTNYDTYYAKWVIPVSEADLERDSYEILIGSTANIVIYNNSVLEQHTFESSDTDVATVDYNGLITATGVGTATITIRGTESNLTKTITVIVNDLSEYRVIFDSQGGTAVADMFVPVNTAIGTLPTTVKNENDFGGWYTDTNWTTPVNSETIISENNTTFYAKWIPIDALVEMNDLYYTTLQEALDLAPSSTQTTIKLLKDFTITSNDVIKISTSNYWGDLYNKNTDRNIIFDLQGYTITNTVKDTYIIRSKATIEIKNGTIINNADGKGAVESNDKSMTINNMTITATGNRQAAYVADTGSIIIKGNSVLSADPAQDKTRGTVQCASNSGKLTILSATISSTSNYGIYNTCNEGNFVVGQKDDIYDTTSISITGGINGINSTKKYALYDGLIRGVTAAVSNEANINLIEDDATKVNDTANGYNRLYYTLPEPPASIRLTLDADGGEVDPAFKVIELGDPVGELPTPTKGIYTFEGWYTEDDVLVTSNREPDTDETYHAVWTYDSSDEVVEFNPNNNAMKTYYANIASWKNDSSNFPSWSNDNKSPNWALDATENTVMMQNFTANNCMCADNQCSTSGTVECDKPEGFDTGMNAQVNVYLSDSTKVKGAQVDYAKGSDGVLYNLIPNQIYRWELASDPNVVYGYVMSTGERRILETGDVRNTRDLGGLPVDTDNNGTVDGYLDYGRLIRGIKLNSQSGIDELEAIGVDSELDLREANSDAYQISRYNRVEAQNYFIDPNGATQTEREYYQWTRNAVTYAMQEVVAGKNLYFHCRIGTDRTGSVAYMLEGLLGVPEEDRIQDYELSFFYGLVRVHRYHNEKPGSNIGTGKERFVYMHNLWDTNDKIYQWYMAGSTNVAADEQLISDFRTAMIISN